MGGRNWGHIMGDHGVNFDKDSLLIKVTNLEWDKGVFHPEGDFLGTFENKDHAVIGGDGCAEHKPTLVLEVGYGCLDKERLATDLNRGFAEAGIFATGG